jgi:hypothetical protein
MAPDGKMQFNTTSDGSMATNLSSLSTVTTGFTDGTGHWVRLSLDISAGTVNFFTSDQPSDTPISSLSWVQLGGANVVHAQTAIFDGTATTQVGAYDNTVSRLSGKVSRAVIIASTDPTATPVVDFNPQPYLQGDTNFTSETGEVWTLQGNAIATSPIDDGVKVDCDAGDYVSGSTFVSSASGETWTLNGNASVFQPPVDASGPFGYLSEGARTNHVPYSSTFTSWTPSAAGTGSVAVVTANYALAPDGTLTASRLVAELNGGTTSGDRSWLSSNTISGFANPHDSQLSVWVKSNTSASQSLTLYHAGGVGQSVHTATTGWTRIDNYAVSNQITDSVAIGLRGGASGGNDSLDILIWGAQLEVAKFPSSYIATAAAAVTRNADTLSSSLNEVYPLTAYAETVQSVDQSSGTSYSYIFSVSEDTTPGQDEFYTRTIQSSAVYQGVAYSGSTVVVNIQGGAPAAGVLRTLTMAVALNDVEVYVDGVSIGSDTSAALPAAPTLMNIGMATHGYTQPYATVRNVKLFDERLTDAEVADL